MSVVAFVRDRVWKGSDAKARAAGIALRPLSWLFHAVAGCRAALYRFGVLRSRSAPIPVVSVGNLSVGGMGKTPFALWLAQRLAESGHRVAIVSRGYGGSAREVTVVSEGDGPLVGADEAGDEPVMMARGFRGPVIIARKRLQGVAKAAAIGCELAVLDDGFQHLALARQCDIVLHDGKAAPLLPAGPRREGLRALRRADAVVLTAAAPAEPKGVAAEIPVFRLASELTGLVEAVGGAWQVHPPGLLAGKRVVAVAGIANPERFYETLREWEAVVEEVYEFADHYRYTSADWQEISRRGQECDLLVTTEKDLVKLEAFPFARGKLMALRVEPRLDGADELLGLVEDRLADVASDDGLG